MSRSYQDRQADRARREMLRSIGNGVGLTPEVEARKSADAGGSPRPMAAPRESSIASEPAAPQRDAGIGSTAAVSSRGSSRFYTKREVADLLGIAVSTLDRWVKRGNVPGVRKLGGQVKFYKPLISAWIERGDASEEGR